ncbi:intermembrane lipid transfer protein VPS13A-like isoform X3 [Clavelina lepadiformis]|uniref:intermembrane lipid transfer protein VPS13A-like isoform X3 n=1 Tax=Clavelina lepadiformis TaxID=159417 RepID=UPI0040435646
MVFESIVVDLMNKYLGAYIENLDASQLKLGIWGGDAVLESLHIKGDALKDLNLPVQIKAGHIGKLTLKIPWKNLYKEAVEATLDGLYLLAVPNVSMQYDAEKEKKRKQQEKQDQLQAIEDQQLISKKGTEKKQDSFAEKLATQVIKNLQIRISNIHVRYEDNVTKSDQPFALGITLDRLNFETTNENWVPCLLDETAKIIYKMVDLQCLAVYWNPKPQVFISDASRFDQLNFFKTNIANPSSVPSNFTYIIKPITLQARLRINPHPKSDLSSPKVDLSIVLEEVGLRILHDQYHGIMELAESMDRMAVNAPFHQFRPTVPVSGNASLWWKYAYKSVSSIGVISNLKNWSWSHIREHRRKIKEYKAVYKEKLLHKKPSQSLVDKLIAMENDLDIFNITLARQTAEVELVRAGQQIRSKRSVHQKSDEKSDGGGWFSGWFGKSKKIPEKKKEEKEATGLDAIMSDEEKQNLFMAIGYSEGETADTSGFEKSYIGTRLRVDLKKVSVELCDKSVSENDLLDVRLLNVFLEIDQRPSAQGLCVTTHMSSFEVDGTAQGGYIPHLISSDVPMETDSVEQHLLTVLFEMRPLDETCDQRIIVDAQPMQIVYDAITINNLQAFLKPPSSVQLQQLRSVAASAYDDIKEQTATGLQHVMETRNVVEIGVHLSSSYVILPYKGTFQNVTDMLILDLGDLSFESSNDGRVPLMKKAKVSKYAWIRQTKPDSSLDLQEMRSKAYDKFNVDLKKMQLLFAKKGDNWRASRKMDQSDLHILEPLSISVLLQKCMICNDATLPKMKISGEVPSLGLKLSDRKLHDMLMLVQSIPLPPSDAVENQAAVVVFENWSRDTQHKDLRVLNKALLKNTDGSLSSLSSMASSTEEDFFTAESDLGSDFDEHFLEKPKPRRLLKQKSKDKQLTDLQLSFTVKEMVLRIKEEMNVEKSTDLMVLRVGTLSLNMETRTWDMGIQLFLDSISVLLLEYTEPNGTPLYLVNSAGVEDTEHLLDVDLLQVKRRSPEFNTVHNKTELMLKIRFGTLKLGVHAQAIKRLVDFAKKLSDIKPPSSAKEPVAVAVSSSTVGTVTSTETEFLSATDVSVASKTNLPPASDGPVINVHLQATLDCIDIAVMDQKNLVTNIQVQGVESVVLVSVLSLKVNAKLHNLTVCDPSEDTLYKNIVSAIGNDILLAEFINYNNATEGPQAFANMRNVDTSIRLKLGNSRIIFLNKFVQKLVEYGAHFSDAKTAVIKTGTAAQKKVAAKAQQLASTNPRVKLDITLNAPSIVVPMHSKSREAITTDLGTLVVMNKFSASDHQHEWGPAVKDEMMVTLRDMKIRKCLFDEEMNGEKESVILEDLVLVTEIVRNLSTSWYHDIPDVGISGHMPPISIKLSQVDIISILGILDQNLSEGKTVTEVQPAIKSKAAEAASVQGPAPDLAKSELMEPAKSSKVWETLKVNFVLDKVVLQLYSDAAREEPLSGLEFVRIKSDVIMRNDKSLKLDFAFGELALEDTRRSHVGGITKLIRNRTDNYDCNLVQAKVIQNADGSSDIDAKICSLNVIISVEFIVRVSNFFLEALPKTKPLEEEPVDSGVPAITESSSGETEPAKSVETAAGKTIDEIDQRSKAVKVNFAMDKPEIVLVSDVQSFESEAILLGMKLNFQFDMTPDGKKQMMAASVEELDLVSCSFRCVLEKATPNTYTHKEILAPCNVNFAGLITDTVQDFDVSATDIRLKATPVIINTISEIVAQMSPVPPEKKEEKGFRRQITSLSLQPLSIWTSQKIADVKLWFMKETEKSSSVDPEEEDRISTSSKIETAKVNIPLIKIQLEAGSGHHTVPLLIQECTVKGSAENWSCGEMSGDFVVTLGMAYFNDALSVWEPLVEPVEVDSTDIESKYEPWKLVVRIQQRKPAKDDSADLPALMTVTIESHNILQTTISNAALKVINVLGKAFKDAALSRRYSSTKKKKRREHSSSFVGAQQSGAAVVVRNLLGCEVLINLGNALELVEKKTKSGNGYPLPHEERLLIDYIQPGDPDIWTVLLNQENMLYNEGARVRVQFPSGHGADIDVSHTGTTFHMISDNKRSLPFVSVVDSVAGIWTVLLRSHIVMYNHLTLDVHLFHKTPKAVKVSEIGAEKSLPIPPHDTKSQSIWIKPVAEKGELESALVSWKNVVDTNTMDGYVVRCAPVGAGARPTFISVTFKEEALTRTEEITFAEPGIEIHLRPPVIFCNYLPFSINIGAIGVAYEGKPRTLEAGNVIPAMDIEMGKSKLRVKIPLYRNKEWTTTLDLQENLPELSPWTFHEPKNPHSVITLAKQISYTDGVMKITLYSPYWMVNKSGLTLDYKSSDENEKNAIQHTEDSQGVILFSFTSKSFFSKNKLQTRVCNSAFSDSFSIDTVGSSGAISCKAKQFNYMIGMKISLTSFSLTKMVTFTSYYSFHNKTDIYIEIAEANANPRNFIPVASGDKVNFWPECSEKFLVLREKDVENSTSTKFRFDLLESGVLLKIGNYAIFAEISVTEASIEISVRNYFSGATALLVVNDTNWLTVECWQTGTESKICVEPRESHHMLWSDPTINREVTWRTSSEKEMTINIFNEQADSFPISSDTKRKPKVLETLRNKLSTKSSNSISKMHYVVFVDGLQRVLLFTESARRAKLVEASMRLERASFELNLSLKGIACSLTDSTAHREVAFLAITSSGLVWEERPRKRWKTLAVKYSQLLENAYQKQLQGQTITEPLTLDKYTFNLNTMKVLQPNNGSLQRSFSPGVSLQFTSNPHQMTVHAKINKLQLDSQLPSAVFPVILNPIPLPKSVAVDCVPKPFIELSFMQTNTENKTFNHIKYFKVLVQEFSIKVDMGFITAILPVFGAEKLTTTREQELQYFQNDLSYTVSVENEDMENSKTIVNYYDILHLSPIKVHVSFSMQNNISESPGNTTLLPFDAFSVVLQSVGVTLSDIDDVVFKLAYFERKFQFFSTSAFTNAVTLHYAGQAIKQLYVLVLGLDVIGNPYGLVMGIAEGVTSLFYEPYQGIIQGPGEFFEGLGLGAINLFSSTVGGAAGAVSKVTGALGKGIASITMDDDFKRQRLEEKNRQPADVTEGLARGGKSLVMGVFSGVTGIVTKPIEGAKKDGAAGFFKGIGKGLIGVVARPVSGVIDLASSTFEGIQKVADMSEEVRKIRPARWIDPQTGIIQPYSLKRAQGAAILEEVDNGRYAKSERYLDHVPLKKDRKAVLLITNKLMIETHTGELLGQWKCDWKCSFHDLTEAPHTTKNGLKFQFKLDSGAATPIFGTSASQTPAQQIENVFKPLSRAFSLGKPASRSSSSGLKNPFTSMFRSSTVAEPPVQFSKGATRLQINTRENDEEQSKTKSIFGMKSNHHSVTFHEMKFAEYILKKILVQWKRATTGSISSYDSPASSTEEHTGKN